MAKQKLDKEALLTIRELILTLSRVHPEIFEDVLERIDISDDYFREIFDKLDKATK